MALQIWKFKLTVELTDNNRINSLREIKVPAFLVKFAQDFISLHIYKVMMIKYTSNINYQR